MEIKEVKTIQSIVREILNATTKIANNNPETRIAQSSIKTFNSILTEVRSKQELKDNFIIKNISPMVIPSTDEKDALGPKAVDLVTNLSAINGVLSDYMTKHRKAIRMGGIDNY